MRIIILLIITILFACKTETKKETPIQQKIKAKEEATMEKNSEPVNEHKAQQSIVDNKKLDYSLLKENIKTQKDSANFLKHYFNQYKEEKDSLSEVLFFDIFPNNFKVFNNLYGFSEEKGEKPLYNDYRLLDYDAIRKNVTNVDYYNKLILLSKNGKWEADNVATLQEVIAINFSKNPKIFLECLKNSRINLDRFWYYFFDSPHPDDPETKNTYDKIIEELKKLDSTMIPVVQKAYLKVKKDWAEH